MQRPTAIAMLAFAASTQRAAPFCLIQRWPFWFGAFRGFTLGVIIFVKDDTDAALVCHEMQHVAQFLRQPFTFWFRYLAELVRHGYKNNRFEIEAREVESAVRALCRVTDAAPPTTRHTKR